MLLRFFNFSIYFFCSFVYENCLDETWLLSFWFFRNVLSLSLFLNFTLYVQHLLSQCFCFYFLFSSFFVLWNWHFIAGTLYTIMYEYMLFRTYVFLLFFSSHIVQVLYTAARVKGLIATACVYDKHWRMNEKKRNNNNKIKTKIVHKNNNW